MIVKRLSTRRDRIHELIANIARRPGMYVGEERYESFAGVILGMDLALRGRPLAGLREWLIVRLGSGNNLTWSALLKDASGARKDGDDADGIRRANVVLQEFFRVRARHGLSWIRKTYRNWLERQDWYDPTLDPRRRPSRRRRPVKPRAKR